MANEELVQRGYVTDEGLSGDRFGPLEVLEIGATSVAALAKAGLSFSPPSSVDYPFVEFTPPRRIGSSKPDRVVIDRSAGDVRPVAVFESKAPGELATEKQLLYASEQVIFYAAVLGVNLAAVSDGSTQRYIDAKRSLAVSRVVYLDDTRAWGPSAVQDLTAESPGETKDPTELAETVWQLIWHATKAEPKECLLTFVEIFMLKFLSDNLPASALPTRYRFDALLDDEATFESNHGTTQIDYYVTDIRPKIKTLFPDNTIADEAGLPELFGLATIVSKASVINGFAFLRSSSETTVSSFNKTFVEILEAFESFGPLTNIEPEFKLRLYETFLRRSARQQRLGQFFTPRNIVAPMVQMAQLGDLNDGAVVLDPAAGVGGFILEPLLFDDALPNNIRMAQGTSSRRIRTIGIDVDDDLHILAKANVLLHLAESVRDPSVTIEALNKAMANTMVLMNDNEMLGSLMNPPVGSVDVVLTNPPYVTKGSSIYREVVGGVKGHRNGQILSEYYDTGGLGVEALFLRYISGALKPGGRAFVIVPLGLLNRSEPRPKRHLLSECNVIASISLPRKAFFNTAQPTYILVLERRHTAADPRPDVFCAIARSTGETLDARRTPRPDENDLSRIAQSFIAFVNGDTSGVEDSPLIKLAPSVEFSENTRWDVTRFWDDDELVKLGVRVPPIDRAEFVDEVGALLEELLAELEEAKRELAALVPYGMRELSIGDPEIFELKPGRRITHQNVLDHPGDLPVYSCFTRAEAEKGRVDRSWAESIGSWIIEEPTVTVNATGASGVGIVFVRRNVCAITDDVIAVRPVIEGIDPDYLASALASVIAQGDYQYEAKLYQGRLKELSIPVPTTHDDELDLGHQRRVGQAVARVERIQDRITDLGTWSKEARLV